MSKHITTGIDDCENIASRARVHGNNTTARYKFEIAIERLQDYDFQQTEQIMVPSIGQSPGSDGTFAVFSLVGAERNPLRIIFIRNHS